MLDWSILRVGLGSDFWKYGEVMYRTSVLSSFSLSIFFDIQIFMSIAHFSTQAMLSWRLDWDLGSKVMYSCVSSACEKWISKRYPTITYHAWIRQTFTDLAAILVILVSERACLTFIEITRRWSLTTTTNRTAIWILSKSVLTIYQTHWTGLTPNTWGLRIWKILKVSIVCSTRMVRCCYPILLDGCGMKELTHIGQSYSSKTTVASNYCMCIEPGLLHVHIVSAEMLKILTPRFWANIILAFIKYKMDSYFANWEKGLMVVFYIGSYHLHCQARLLAWVDLWQLL